MWQWSSLADERRMRLRLVACCLIRGLPKDKSLSPIAQTDSQTINSRCSRLLSVRRSAPAGGSIRPQGVRVEYPLSPPWAR